MFGTGFGNDMGWGDGEMIERRNFYEPVSQGETLKVETNTNDFY